MRTTIDLPDPLFRRAKAVAALHGVSLKDLLTAFIERGLTKEPERYGRSQPIPVGFEASGPLTEHMSNADLYELIEPIEGSERHG